MDDILEIRDTLSPSMQKEDVSLKPVCSSDLRKLR